MPDIYRYKKSIDSKILHAVAEVLRTPVLFAEKIHSGEINHVYKVATPKGLVIARVFRYKQWPEDGKLQWIEKQLSKYKIPHAKMLYYSRANTYFPNGFMISEYLDGVSGTEAIGQKLLTEKQLYTAYGKLARKIHSISTQKFGPLNQGKGKYTDYAEMQRKGAVDILKKLYTCGALKTDYSQVITERITQTLTAQEKRIQPCLLHGDMSETNTIVTKDRKVFLIDWDNARSGFWLADFIEFSRRHMYENAWSKNPHRMRNARGAFFKGYGKIPFTASELARLENTLQIIRHVWQMNYYKFDNVDPKKFKVVYTIFKKLLKQSS